MRKLAVLLVVAVGALTPTAAHADHEYDGGGYYDRDRGSCDSRWSDCSDDDGDRKENCVGFVNFCNITIPGELVRDLIGGGGQQPPEGGAEG